MGKSAPKCRAIVDLAGPLQPLLSLKVMWPLGARFSVFFGGETEAF